MGEEVRAAIEEIKAGKVVGRDGVAAEVLKALGDFAIDQPTSLFQRINESGNMTDRMCDSVFVALPKVDGTLECSKHRTLSIMRRINKLLLKIFLKCIETRLRPQISEEQFGFVPDKGTNNALLSLIDLTERALEVSKDVSVCFVDYEKTLEKVRHVDLLRIQKEAG